MSDAGGASVQRLRDIVYAQTGAMPAEVFPHALNSWHFRRVGNWLLVHLLAEGYLSDLDVVSPEALADYLVWPRTIWSPPGHCLYDLDVRPRLRLSMFGLLVYRMSRASGYDHEEAVSRITEDYGGFI